MLGKKKRAAKKAAKAKHQARSHASAKNDDGLEILHAKIVEVDDLPPEDPTQGYDRDVPPEDPKSQGYEVAPQSRTESPTLARTYAAKALHPNGERRPQKETASRHRPHAH